jgi:carbonic anhydrase
VTGNVNNWVRDGYEACAATVPNQSPIILNQAGLGQGVKPNGLNPANFRVSLVAQRVPDHNNFDFLFTTTDGSQPSIQWGGTRWQFTEFHFHVPAEHVVVGARTAVMEVHVKASGIVNGKTVTTGVFGIQFALGSPAEMSMAPVAAAMRDVSGQTLDFAALLSRFQTQASFHYAGSLTTPGCDQPVPFFVLQNVVTIDAASWQSIATSLLTLNSYPSNARALQPVGARNVIYLDKLSE